MASTFNESAVIKGIRGIHTALFARYANKHLASLPEAVRAEVCKPTHMREPAIKTTDDAIRYAYFDALRRNINQYILGRTRLVSWVSVVIAVMLAGALSPAIFSLAGNSPQRPKSYAEILGDPSMSAYKKAQEVINKVRATPPPGLGL